MSDYAFEDKLTDTSRRVLMDARMATGDLILEYCGDRLIQHMGHCDRFPVFAAGSCREWHCRQHISRYGKRHALQGSRHGQRCIGRIR